MSAAPEPVESIRAILETLEQDARYWGQSPYINRGEINKALDKAEAETTRLLVQAKLEELQIIEDYPRVPVELMSGVQLRKAALQSQLEGAAGVANDKPDVPTGADSGKGKS